MICFLINVVLVFGFVLVGFFGFDKFNLLFLLGIGPDGSSAETTGTSNFSVN